MSRRRGRNERDEPSISDVATLARQPDVLRSEVLRTLEHWTDRERADFQDLVARAGSDLQREFILRAAAARHSLEELEDLAEHLRPRADADVFELCTVRPGKAGGSVVKLLRAEADPLYAMALNGQAPPPRRRDGADAHAYSDLIGDVRGRRPPAALFVPPPQPPGAQGKPLTKTDLGNSADEASARPPSANHKGGRADAPGAGGSASCAALNESVSHLGIRFREQPVDGGSLPLEKALSAMVRVLRRGIPVPVALGRKEGEHGRQVLVLQVQPAGDSQAFQFHDPFAQETVWVHERTLLARTELPFDARVWRRVTAVYLPLDGAGGSPSRTSVR